MSHGWVETHLSTVRVRVHSRNQPSSHTPTNYAPINSAQSRETIVPLVWMKGTWDRRGSNRRPQVSHLGWSVCVCARVVHRGGMVRGVRAV